MDYGVTYFLTSTEAADIPGFGNPIRNLWDERGWASRTYDSVGGGTSTETIVPDGYRMVLDEYARGSKSDRAGILISRVDCPRPPSRHEVGKVRAGADAGGGAFSGA